jgi:hypothetical protein
MARTTRMEERQAALRFCIVALGWLACLFLWACLLSFDIADAPSTTVWPHADPPHNVCGTLGAFIAYNVFWYVGLAAFPLLALLHIALVAWSGGAGLSDRWLRGIGLVLIVTSSAALVSMLMDPTPAYPVTGPGGALGSVIAAALQAQLQIVGSLLVLSLSLVVGLVLAADDLLLRIFRWLRWARTQSAPVLARGGSAVAGAGTAMAAGVATLGGRLGRMTARGDADEAADARKKPHQLEFDSADAADDEEDDVGEEADEDAEFEEDADGVEDAAEEEAEDEEEDEIVATAASEEYDRVALSREGRTCSSRR